MKEEQVNDFVEELETEQGGRPVYTQRFVAWLTRAKGGVARYLDQRESCRDVQERFPNRLDPEPKLLDAWSESYRRIAGEGWSMP